MDQRIIAAERWARSQSGVISARQAAQVGLPHPWPARLAAAGRWRRLLRGVYWTGGAITAPAPRAGEGHGSGAGIVAQLTAARLFAGGGLAMAGVVTGRAAARLWGFDTDRSAVLTELVLPAGLCRAQPAGLRYVWRPLAAVDVTAVRGIPCTTVTATLLDLAAKVQFEETLVLADAALRLGLISAEAVRTLADAGHGRAFACADGRAESPFESRVRAELILAGLPPPELQHTVRADDGTFLARVDLAWPAQRVLVEADGAATHTGPDALSRDLRRQNELVGAGFTMLRFTWPDLGAIADVAARALRQAGTGHRRPHRRAS